MSKKFTVRRSAPAKWTDIYNNYNNGGLSWCINGRPINPVSNVLANCVGYACSRFNEIYNELSGYTGMKYRDLNCNAEDFWTRAKDLGLKRGKTPKDGAIMVWEGLGSLAGHVAIVERVISETEVYTSESGYESAYFWNSTRYKGSGNWGANGNYKFRGFIYNPAVKDGLDPLPISGKWGRKTTRAAQTVFNTVVDGIVSGQLKAAKKRCPACSTTAWRFDNAEGGSALIKAMQKWLGVKADGRCGLTTIRALQAKLKVTQTGNLDVDTVKAFQKWLNKKI